MEFYELPNEIFDFVIFGTDLTESILCYFLSCLENKRILVIDFNKNYSGCL